MGASHKRDNTRWVSRGEKKPEIGVEPAVLVTSEAEAFRHFILHGRTTRVVVRIPGVPGIRHPYFTDYSLTVEYIHTITQRAESCAN